MYEAQIFLAGVWVGIMILFAIELWEDWAHK